MKRIILFALLIIFNVKTFSEDGISEKEILLGQSCSITGPISDIGISMQAGLRACFEKKNSEGGINGRKIRLITMDDGYEPQRAIANTRKFLNHDKVFLLIGAVGTPTSEAVVPIIEKEKVPFIGPFSGAEFLRHPFKRYVINVRGSYHQEMEKIAEYLVDKRGLQRIACFYQNDSYGKTGLTGITIALKKRNLELVGIGTYERNSLAVKKGLLEIRKSNPEAVVMTGTDKPCAEFIKSASKIGLQAVFCSISVTATEDFAKELTKSHQECIVSEVVAFPWDQSISIVREYKDAMKKYQPNEELGFLSLEGYIVGKLFCMAAEGTETEKELNRENFIDTILQTKTFDLGGISLEYGPDDNQGMDQVFLTIIQNGKIKKIED